MIGDDELDQLNSIHDRYKNIKTVLSGANAQNFASVLQSSTPDINSVKSGLSGIIDSDMSGLDADSLMNSMLGGYSSGFSSSNITSKFKKFVKINGTDDDDGIIQKLLKLILGIGLLPMRLGYMSMSLMEATAALTIGIDGVIKSVGLATADIYILIITIVRIIFKYASCILSFIISTIGGCLFIHFFTLLFFVIYAFIIFLTDKFNDAVGIDFSPMVDDAMGYISWPSAIQTFCYSCFGTPVKLRDILSDVSVIDDIGNMISYDFNNTMPRYMKPAMPIGKMSLDHLNKAMK
jgi:hypothetical protein